MKKGAFLIIAFLTSSFLLFSQGKGRKQRINREEGGFIKCKSVCNIHDRNCLYSNGYHEVISYRLDNGEKFCTYKGNFLLRRYHGYGEYHNADGSLDYKGTFTYGFFKKGTLTNIYGDTLKGTFKKEDKKWFLNDGYISSSRWYTLSDAPDNMYRSGSGDKMFVRGNVKDGKLHGHVYFKILEGDYQGTEFDGKFVNGKIDGCGIMKIYRKDNFINPSNDPYSSDCYISFKSINPNGDIYAGQWKNCSYNGWGVTISQEYVNSFGFWNNDEVSTDIPYPIVTQTIDNICGDDFVDWKKITPSDTSLIDSSSYELPEQGGSISFAINPSAVDSDNRGNISTGVKITYEVNYIKASVIGDFPPGKYNIKSSENALELLKSLESTLKILTKKVKDSLSYTLIDTNTTIDFKIFASTDPSPIGYNGIKYKWAEYGLDSIYNGSVYLLDDLNDYTIKHNVHINDKIKHNSQLAFLRAVGIKKHLKDSLKINTQKINYQFNIDTTSRKRTIGVEMLIHNRGGKKNPKIKQNNKIENSIPQNLYKYDNSAAIIIYLTQYRDQSIRNDALLFAETDGNLMKKYFSQTMGIPDKNIKIIANENATINDIKNLFEEYLLEMAKQRISNFFIYYQGHGCADENESIYLMPYNIQTNNNGSVKLEDIDSLAGYINTAKKIINDSLNKDVNFFTIFDACSSYNETKYGGRRSANYSNKNNTCIISASEKFSQARYDKTLQHSLLTYGFCYSLFDFEKTDKNNDNKLSFDEIYEATKKYVELQTKQTSNYQQIPTKYGKGNWDFEILRTEDIEK